MQSLCRPHYFAGVGRFCVNNYRSKYEVSILLCDIAADVNGAIQVSRQI